MKTTVGQLIRYGIVGLASNAVGYLIYLSVTAAGMEHKLAMSLLYALGVAQTFIFNKHWSFGHCGTHGPAFVRYCISYGLGYIVNWTALYLFVDRMGWPHEAVQGAMVFVVATLLFVLQKFWVFRSAATSVQKGEFMHE